MKAAYYQASIGYFLGDNPMAILGILTQEHGFTLEQQQRDAWRDQIIIMQRALSNRTDGHILFEFAIPRMGKRADVVMVARGIVLVLEFKVGASSFDRHAVEQVHDYALDLKNFHRGSHALPIVPLLVATRSETNTYQNLRWASDHVAEPVLAGEKALKGVLEHLSDFGRSSFDFASWLGSGYQPTPTIVEAAQALYQDHTVEEIARSDAGAQNLGATSECIAEIIDHSKINHRKAICLVTGVPGAGKTLAGLNVATKRAQEHSDEHAVFLSGNGPLVAVLREALARDERDREGTSKSAAHRKVASFIQNIHHFRDEALRDPGAPYERVVVFDEAQRAWTRDQAAKFMKTKRQIHNFDMSEPEFLISVMDRHPDWCVIVCLVGGGQEINVGEAGLSEWILALSKRFAHWNVYGSTRLTDDGYVSDSKAASFLESIHERNGLHLAVSMRSFRAESISEFVGHVVENRPAQARAVYGKVSERYPIWLTRSLAKARQWLKHQARGSERYGLLASSGAHRLRPEGLHVKTQIDAPTWFLNDRLDVRSSFYCEEVATEFDVQGLELDWAAVCWDGDFRYRDSDWSHYRFRGTSWQNLNNDEGQLYLRNAYRVILTRARQGMIIFVPPGSDQDPTRRPSFYDETFAYLEACGLRTLDGVHDASFDDTPHV